MKFSTLFESTEANVPKHVQTYPPSGNELISATIEAVANRIMKGTSQQGIDLDESQFMNASIAQAKLNQSLNLCFRQNLCETRLKDNNFNFKITG